MGKITYRKQPEFWTICVPLFIGIIILAAIIGGKLTLSLVYFGLMIILEYVCVFGEGYSIDGNSLVIYMFYQGTRYPINKITRIRYVKSRFSLFGKSRYRLAISFSDRTILKSTSPMQLSPKDTDRFVAELLRINSDIIVMQPTGTATA